MSDLMEEPKLPSSNTIEGMMRALLTLEKRASFAEQAILKAKSEGQVSPNANAILKDIASLRERIETVRRRGK